jgi:hypothetical protein
MKMSVAAQHEWIGGPVERPSPKPVPGCREEEKRRKEKSL